MRKETAEDSRSGHDDAAAHLDVLGLSALRIAFLKLTTCSFRLHDLPQELRDMIYDYSLEPRAIFRHTNREDQREQNQGYDLPETNPSKGTQTRV